MFIVHLFRAPRALIRRAAIVAATFACVSNLSSQSFLFERVALGGGGMTTRVVPHPAVPGLIYARSDTTGLFRMEPGSNVWQNVTDNFPVNSANQLKSCAGIAVDPSAGSDPSRQNLVFALFGSYHRPDQMTDLSAVGLYRSTDRGNTWSQVWNGPLVTTPGNSVTISAWGANSAWRQRGPRLAVDPANPDVLWVTTATDGMYISYNARDASPTFTKFTGAPVGYNSSHPLPSFGPANPTGIIGLLVDPRGGTVGSGSTLRSRRVYIMLPSSPAADTTFVFNGGVWMTDDGGSTWAQLPLSSGPSNPSAIVAGAGTSVLVSEFYNGNTSDNIEPLATGGVYRWSPGDSVWVKLPGTNGARFAAIAVSPNDPQKIVVSTSAQSIPQDLWSSNDNGQTWTKRSWDNFTAPNNRGINYLEDLGWMSPGFQYPGGGFSLAFDPSDPEKIWTSDGFGVTLLGDPFVPGDVVARPFLAGLENTVSFGLAVPPTGPYKLYTIMADVSGMRSTSLTSFPETQLVKEIDLIDRNGAATMGDVEFSSYDPTKVAIVRSRLQGSTSSVFFKLYLSPDNGTTWTRYNLPVSDAADPAHVFAGGAKVAFSATNANHMVLLAANRRPKYTTDAFSGGPTWNDSNGVIMPNASNNYADYALQLKADTVDGQRFFHLQSSGGGNMQVVNVYMSTDGGATWINAATLSDNASEPVLRGRNKLVTVKNPNTGKGELWLSIRGKGLYRCADTALSNSSLTLTPVSAAKVVDAACIVFGKAGPGQTLPTLYIAGTMKPDGVNAEDGIFMSADLGATVTRITPAGKNYVGGYNMIRHMEASWTEYGRFFTSLGGGGVLYASYPTTAAPGAINDSGSTSENTVVNTAAPGVLSNDTGADTPLTVAGTGTGAPRYIVTSANGDVTLNQDGSYTYSPPPYFFGADSFAYSVRDESGQVSGTPGTVNLTVSESQTQGSLSSAGLTGSAIGGATGGGRVLVDGAGIQVRGSGAGLGSGTDSIYLAQQSRTGYFRARVNLADLDSPAGGIAGLMVREGTGGTARFVQLGSGLATGYAASAKLVTGGTVTNGSATPPAHSVPDKWMQLTRNGDVVALATSSDGIIYTPLETFTVPNLSVSTNVGLFAANGGAGAEARARFLNYSFVTPLLADDFEGTTAQISAASNSAGIWSIVGSSPARSYRGLHDAAGAAKLAWTQVTYGDVVLEADVLPVRATQGNAGQVQLIARAASTTSFYTAGVVIASNQATFTWQLKKHGSTITTLASTSAATFNGAAHRVRFETVAEAGGVRLNLYTAAVGSIFPMTPTLTHLDTSTPLTAAGLAGVSVRFAEGNFDNLVIEASP